MEQYAGYIRALRKILTVIFWSLVSWVAWKSMFDYSFMRARIPNFTLSTAYMSVVVERILFTIFISSLVVFAEKFLIQVIAVSLIFYI